MEFKIGDQVLLHHTKAEKQWSGKFDPKWDSSFHIHEALGNRAYKLRLENRILKKVAHGNWLKIYHVKQELSSSVPQLGTQISLIRPEDIPRDLEPIIRYGTKIRAREEKTRVQLKLNIPSPTHHLKGNMGGKIAFRWGVEKKKAKNKKKLEEIKQALVYGTKLPETGEWTPDNAQEWK
ncbi:hypothetical protein G9A89_017688 [Geosiphon pyriformis]|nr:hypothetical protein G9A89_017688 [Geosiphon pyriformis]